MMGPDPGLKKIGGLPVILEMGILFQEFIGLSLISFRTCEDSSSGGQSLDSPVALSPGFQEKYRG